MKKIILSLVLSFLFSIQFGLLSLNAQSRQYDNLPDNPPFGSFDSPANGISAGGSVALTGWALDDTKVESVKIYRFQDWIPIYVGDATFVEGARPDVAAAYPGYPNNTSAGWGYMLLTYFLPNKGNGSYIFSAVAIDNSGHQTTLGYKAINCDNAHSNKPFGAIDAPLPGETISGTYAIQGWVLTPPPNKIPEDGSTIRVLVDDKDIGKARYNVFRQDIASLFPDCLNRNGAVAYFELKTKSFTNGIHRLGFLVTDNAGNAEGIGSRFFRIKNKVNSNYTLMVNSQDPQILSVKAPDGRIINTFGKRDENGLPTSLNQIVIINKDKKELVYYLDEKNRPVKMIADNGTQFKLEWLSDTRIALTVLANDGETQINTEVDLSSQNQVKKNSPGGGQDSFKRKRNLKFEPPNVPIKAQNYDCFDNIYGSDSVYLNVTQCGEPTDADVWVDIYTYNENPFDRVFLRRSYEVTRIGKGVYKVKIPSGLAPSLNVSTLCNTVVLLLEGLDMAEKAGLGPYICAAVSLASAPLGPAVSALIYSGCEAVRNGLKLYTSWLTASPEYGFPSIGEYLCDAKIFDIEIPQYIGLVGVVDGLPDNTRSPMIKAPGNGPYPDINLDLGSKTVITGFTLVPPAPAEKQGYTATARASCLLAGSNVKLSMVGTDGYSDSVSEYISKNRKFAEFTLTVPGAETGVRDTCTFEIFSADGKVLRKTASLVFGN